MAQEHMEPTGRREPEDPNSAAALRKERDDLIAGKNAEMIKVADKLVTKYRDKLIQGQAIEITRTDLGPLADSKDTFLLIAVMNALKAKGFVTKHYPGNPRDPEHFTFSL